MLCVLFRMRVFDDTGFSFTEIQEDFSIFILGSLPITTILIINLNQNIYFDLSQQENGVIGNVNNAWQTHRHGTNLEQILMNIMIQVCFKSNSRQ